jgi:hypothetical protein
VRFNFEENRTREATTNTPYINLFEVGTERDSLVDGIDCINMFDNTVASSFPCFNVTVFLFHNIMFALDAIDMNEKGGITGDGVGHGGVK